MIKGITFAIAILMLAVPFRVNAQTPLNIAYSDFPPFTGNSLTPNSADSPGMMMEIYNAVLPKMGFSITYMQLPPARIVNMMNAGETIDLYLCADHTIDKRPHYAFGPPILHLSIDLIQKVTAQKLNKTQDLKNSTILKQEGFKGLTKLLDPSNNFVDVQSKSIAGVFATRDIEYLIGFKDRLEILFRQREDVPAYRIYNLRSFSAHLCLNKRVENAEQIVHQIYDRLIAFQDTIKGRQIMMKYDYKGRLGE